MELAKYLQGTKKYILAVKKSKNHNGGKYIYFNGVKGGYLVAASKRFLVSARKIIERQLKKCIFCDG